MNTNRQLSTRTYGPRHTQPHMPHDYATKKKTGSVKRQMRPKKNKEEV